MVLNVTCHHDCLAPSTELACLQRMGCAWTNATAENKLQGLGQCRITSAQEFTGKAWIGVLLSLVGDIIINVGMNSMKYAHNINEDPATGKPIKHFTRIPWWWFGILGIIGGEVGNLIAYGYAPASIVTPIGSIGVVTNVLITTFVLKEPFTRQNLLGVIFVIAGIVIVVFYAPLTVVFVSSKNLWEDVLFTRNMAIYLAWMVVMIGILLPLSKKYGQKTVVIYVALCAVIASLTIVCAKTFSTMLSNAFANGFETEFLSPWPYVTLLVMTVTCVVSMGYVNTAMMHFGNSQVVPVYFALFTTASVGAAAWVYYEFNCIIDWYRGVMFFVGILTAILGVFLVSRSSKPGVAPGGSAGEATASKGEGATGDLEEGVQGGMNAAAGGHQQRDTKHKRQPSVNGPGPATPVDEFPDTPSGPDRPSSRLGGRDTIREAGKHQLTGQINHDLGFQGHHATNPARAAPTPAQLQVLWPSDSSPVQTITSGGMAKREKQVREGRCGLSQLKPLPPPVSPDHKRQVAVVSKD